MKIRQETIVINNIPVVLYYKRIKNIYLRVLIPSGQVVITAPYRIDRNTLRNFAISRLDWIRKKQSKVHFLPPLKAPVKYEEAEIHFYLGKPYQLKILISNNTRRVKLNEDRIELYAAKNSAPAIRKSLLESWYRKELKELIPPLISRWEKEMNVQVNEFGIKKMKTRWGTCNIRQKRIWLNLELAKKPLYCLEYIVVHEMIHLLEKNHNDKFKAYMNKFLPDWKTFKKDLLQ